MLMRQLFFIAAIWGALATASYAQQPAQLTLEEAVQLLYSNNNAIKISQTTTEAAKAEKQQLNASWYPFISAAGGYFHFSNDISADANMGEITQQMLQSLQETFPYLEQLASQILPQLQHVMASLGNITLSVPLLKQNIATLDAAAVWPLITGGKRIYAGRIGNSIQESAELLAGHTINAQLSLMLNTWYTLKLSTSIAQMQKENLQYMEKLYLNTGRLMEEGFINKAEYLVVQVARDEASNEAETAVQNVKIAQKALEAVLGKEIGGATPLGNFFTLDTIPPVSSIYEKVINKNLQLKILETQNNILENRKKIAESNYIPNVVLFARQNIWSNNIPKNLMPRTTIGAAMQWDIFDGFTREKEIKKSKLQQQQLEYATEQAKEDLFTAALALRSRMEDASFNIRTTERTLQLAQELLREREKSFTEGMCTSTDIVAARTAVTKARTALNLAGWEYCTSLANLLALCSETEYFITLHNEYGK